MGRWHAPLLCPLSWPWRGETARLSSNLCAPQMPCVPAPREDTVKSRLSFFSKSDKEVVCTIEKTKKQLRKSSCFFYSRSFSQDSPNLSTAVSVPRRAPELVGRVHGRRARGARGAWRRTPGGTGTPWRARAASSAARRGEAATAAARLAWYYACAHVGASCLRLSESWCWCCMSSHNQCSELL